MMVGVVLSKGRKGECFGFEMDPAVWSVQVEEEVAAFYFLVYGPPSGFARMVKVAVRRRRSDIKRASRPQAVSQGQEPYLFNESGRVLGVGRGRGEVVWKGCNGRRL